MTGCPDKAKPGLESRPAHQFNDIAGVILPDAAAAAQAAKLTATLRAEAALVGIALHPLADGRWLAIPPRCSARELADDAAVRTFIDALKGGES